MHSISLEQYEALGGIHSKSHVDGEGKVVWDHADGSTSTRPYTTEKAWYRHESLLGVVVFDNIDDDWSFVALSKQDGSYKAFEVETSFRAQEEATAALERVFARGPKKKKAPPLLVDTIYRDTFNKRAPNPRLRERRVNARRIVLSDEMAAFLYSIRVQLFLGKASKPISRRLTYQRVDDCRYFARLPHKITWLEYSLAAMYEREIEINEGENVDLSGLGTAPAQNREKLARARESRARIGWLMFQHPKTETAFSAYCFMGVPEKASFQYPAEIVWTTDDAALPWTDLVTTDDDGQPLPESPSAYVSGIPGYDRAFAGFRKIEPASLMVHHESLTQSDVKKFSPQGRAGMMWVFLSTFNKVPIFAETEIKRSHGFVARGGYHRFLDHKILTVNIPETKARAVVRSMAALIRRRAHVVRGHWRDDYRLQKGNKALWIAEHQRGDASIGFVTHDYAVHHEQNGGH